jgi:hypothetical protein
MNQIWTEIETQFIRENAALLTDKVGAAQLSSIVGRHISVNAWRKKRQARQALGLTKAPGRGVCKLARE